MDEIRDGERRDLAERTFEFARRIVNLCRTLDRAPGVGRTLGRQLLRAGCSIGANVEEGIAGQSRADFISKYSIARKEARETHYWLRLIAATSVISPERVADLTIEANELIAILTALVKSANKSD